MFNLLPNADTSSILLRIAMQVTEGRGAPKNINTTSPFYALTGLLADGLIERDDKWMKWLDEWGEWVMRDLPSMSCRSFRIGQGERCGGSSKLTGDGFVGGCRNARGRVPAHNLFGGERKAVVG